MGVNLKGIIKTREISLDNLSNMTVAIDAYNAIYQFLSSIRTYDGEYLKNNEGKVTSHLSGLFYRNMNFLTLGIKPIYVFDGKPPSEKRGEIEKRKMKKIIANEKYLKAIEKRDVVSARKYSQATTKIEDYMIEESKKILSIMGIPVIQAPSEGEATAAYLNSCGISNTTASQDYDSLLFGAKTLIRNMTVSGKRKLPNKQIYVNVETQKINLDENLLELGVSREQLVDIGILIGTDYNPNGFEQIGPIRALKLIKKHNKLENISELKNELDNINYNRIRSIFLEPEIPKIGKLEWKNIDEEKLIKFLCDQNAFSNLRISNTVKKLKEKNELKANSLEKWLK